MTAPIPPGFEGSVPDEAVGAIASAVTAICGRNGKTPQDVLGDAIRRAVDEVVDGPRTGRWDLHELEKTEKTYIGTRIEIVVRNALGLEKKGPLDTWIAGFPVDIKFSINSVWAIPDEAVNEVCLVLGMNEGRNSFKVGVVRCVESSLNKGRNKDGKRTLSLAGRKSIVWIVEDGSLQPNFIAELPAEIREKILKEGSGQARVRQLVTLWQERPIPRAAIETIAQQKDPLRRLRQDRGNGRLGGLWVLSGRYDKEMIAALGFSPIAKDEFMSIDPDKYGDRLSGFAAKRPDDTTIDN